MPTPPLQESEQAATEGMKAMYNMVSEEALRRGLTKEQRETMTIGELLGEPGE